MYLFTLTCPRGVCATVVKREATSPAAVRREAPRCRVCRLPLWIASSERVPAAQEAQTRAA